MSRTAILTSILGLGLLGLLAIGPAASGEPAWQKLGDRYVSHSVDRDEIQVRAKDGRFDAIKLRVNYRAVRFRDVKIHFGNGDVQDVQLRRRIPAGGETRVILLQGDRKRIVDKVVFWYNTVGRGRAQAEVELWGRR